jgi:hypothetical protein
MSELPKELICSSLPCEGLGADGNLWVTGQGHLEILAHDPISTNRARRVIGGMRPIADVEQEHGSPAGGEEIYGQTDLE